ncbi:putative disease resistance RPP13-like protein 1 [Neltuma alba]|uniref:putative disease resistance RPP13-like protein 1 n=1 Tax=Neltuma alba TaxID=207710 RepID=UPI0010A2DB64|nr:putative disease resistance RPP13-like protein 1 [Prosopis alba]
MAASLVGGPLLSAVFNVLLERLTPELTDLINKIGGKKLDHKLLNHLKPSLIAARAVLNDAELKQFADPAVKDWLDELKDAVYDLEDLMDEISTRAATQKKVSYFSFASLSLGDTSMANKLEVISDRIEYIVGQKDALDLKKTTGTGPETLSWRSPVTSHVKVSEVYGRTKEKEDIIKLMFSGEGGPLSVIPIVGMGGVGKTTLVNLVYNDVKQKFDLTAWVCVSEAFDLLKIAQTIIKSISPDFVCENLDLNLLQLHLAEKLERKTFLVVLDDFWNDNYNDWDTLKSLLHNGVEGCKILVTTRLERVALMVKTISSFYCLDIMSDKDCLSIFAAHAFYCKDSTVNSCLEKIGSDVARKCKGLPLAAKVLGGLFRSKPHFEDWNNILKESMWDSLDDKIIPALRVSYYYLPPNLKQCFAYCSLFPKDYEFNKEKLILMWMAEGFLQPSKRNMTLEEVGQEYFDDLTSRSFFQPSPPEPDVYFGMHDLIHELATHVAGDFCLRLGENGNKIGNKTRHLSCNFQYYPCLSHEVFQKSKGLRTFIGLDFFNLPRSIGNASHIVSSNLKSLRMLSLEGLWSLKIVLDLIGEFIHLRYLDLSWTGIRSLPDSICKLFNLQTLKLRSCSSLEMLPSDMKGLVNLRYLDLSFSKKIVSLPDSLCELYNLQTLRLGYCDSLKMLPRDMQDLVNLQHLDVAGTSLKEMPRGLGSLKDLKILCKYVVAEDQGTGIGELGGMPNLKGGIEISKLEIVKNGKEAYKARMMEKKHIKWLALSWSRDGDVEDTRTERDILGNLQPYWGLEDLEIRNYRGTIFPDWLGSHRYRNMTMLQLTGCENCCILPHLGQLPALKDLRINGLNGVKRIGDELLKGDDCASIIPFPSLEVLDFSSMTSWEQWHSINTVAFPKLRILRIYDCPTLIGNLPPQLPSLETLEIERCPFFCSSIPRCPKLQKLATIGSENVGWQQQELPPSLFKLKITGCRMLESMAEALSKPSHLQQLTITGCSNISPLTIHLPQSLQHLRVHLCENVDFVMSSTAPLQNLQSISIASCNFVKFMWDDMEGLLPNLRKLSIEHCEEMEAFPEGILVASLRELIIGSSGKLLSHQAEWHLLSNITYLRIQGRYDIRCFPEGCSLPTTLTTLELYFFKELGTLNCTGLQHLTSLQHLKIMYCPKLEKMSGEKLPASLRKLHIYECPLLEEKYHNKDEQLFCQISHIPNINLFWK